MIEPEIVVHTREELIVLLDEAAEIEHGLMCCYLYAMFSLKRGEAEGLTAKQASAVDRWRGLVRSVAVDEMVHLALVSNLLSALGAPPHFERQNFPVGAGYHPGGVVVKLAPFDMATLEHFIFLERPEGMELPDGVGFEHANYRRAMRKDLLMPAAQDYLTVGHLYRSLRTALAHLADKLGPERLFCGDPALQIDTEMLNMDGMGTVTDVASAQAAIDRIVEQGEGSPGKTENSHYWRFCEVKREYQALLAEDPNFAPAFPAARNPLQKTPADPTDRVWISAEPAAHLIDLGNATYNLMLRSLARAFSVADPRPARQAILDGAIDLMFVISGIAEALARLPASDDHPGINAGLSFATTRSATLLHQPAGWQLLVERYDELANACVEQSEMFPALGEASSKLRGVGDRLRAFGG